MNGVGAKDDDDTGKSRERDRDLRGDAESFARLHSDDQGRTRTGNQSANPRAAKPAIVRSLPKTPEAQSLHIRLRAFAMFSDEAVDPRRDDGQRYQAEFEDSIGM